MKQAFTLKGRINELAASITMAFAAIRGLDRYLFTLEQVLITKGVMTKEDLDKVRDEVLKSKEAKEDVESLIIAP